MAADTLVRCYFCWKLWRTPWLTAFKTPCASCGTHGENIGVIILECVHCNKAQFDHADGYNCLFAPTVFAPLLRTHESAVAWEVK